MKNTWLEIEVNACDFMPDMFCYLCTNYDTAEELENLDKDLQRIATEGARRDEYGTPEFQRYFFEHHNDQWRKMLEIIDSVKREYIRERLNS